MYKKYLLLAVSYALSCVCTMAETRSWSEKFLQERAQAFGPVSSHSTDDVRDFLALSGKSVRKEVFQQPDATQLYRGQSDDVDESPEPIGPVLRSTRPKRTKRTRQSHPTEKVPMDALLERSRRAYSSGQLEEARRYYMLVKKADPSSFEATERLAEIRKQME